jgi:hypothetical protein
MTNPRLDEDAMTDEPLLSHNALATALLEEEAWSWTRKYNFDLYQHMHALGVIAANYNRLESGLALLLYMFVGEAMSKAGAYLFPRLSNAERLDLLRQLYTEQITDPDFLDRLEWFVTGYGQCTENRNILMHSEPHNYYSRLKALSVLELKKASKNNPGTLNFISLELNELRQVADDIDRFDDYVFGLVLFESARRMGGKITLFGKEIEPPLPDKPPEPIRLTLSPQKASTGN